jgi:hypothetical protein
MEVGTKSLTKGDKKEANDYFKKSFDLYNLFWGLNLGLINNVETHHDASLPTSTKEKPLPQKSFMGTISKTINKILDCCRE